MDHLVHNKETFTIHHETTDRIIDKYLINLQNLKRIDCDFFDGNVSNLKIEDDGLVELGKLTKLEELKFGEGLLYYEYKFLSKWVSNKSPVLETLKSFHICGLEFDCLKYLSEFKNLKKLEITFPYFGYSYQREAFSNTIINFPSSLESLSIDTMISSTNIVKQFTDQCENLTELRFIPDSDEAAALALSKYAKTIKKIELVHDFKYEDIFIYGSYMSEFHPSNTFPHLKTLELVWIFNSGYIRAFKNIAPTLENLTMKVKRSPNELLSSLLFALKCLTNLSNLELNFEIVDSRKSENLVVNGSAHKFILNQWESFKPGCKLETLYKKNCASCFDLLPEDTMKHLELEINNGNIEHLAKLEQFTNLQSLILRVSEPTNDYSHCKLPKSLTTLKISGEITGMECGFSSMLLTASRLQQLSFKRTKLEDGFFEKIIPLSHNLDNLIVKRNTGLTKETIEHLKHFTNCRVLISSCFDDSILSSQFSIFCQETPKIYIPTNEVYKETRDDKIYYPNLDYNDIESVISYTKERINSREMKEAYNTFDRLFNHLQDNIMNINLDEICKLFLKSCRFLHNLNTSPGFQVISKVWKEKKIEFNKCEIGYLENISSRSSSAFHNLASILLDLGYYVKVIGSLKNYLTEYTDKADLGIIERIFNDLMSGKQDITSFSGGGIVEGAESALRHFPNNETVLRFIKFLIGHEFYKHSQNTIEKFNSINNQLSGTVSERDYKYFNDLFNRKGYKLNEVLVEVPKLNTESHREYRSQTFEAFGCEWAVDFIPKPRIFYSSHFDTCKINLSQIRPISNQLMRGKLDVFMCDHDFEPMSYISASKKIDWDGKVLEYRLKNQHLNPYSIDNEDFVVYKFVVGLRNLEYEAVQTFDHLETIHKGHTELSSRNYPPFIHRFANKFPTIIQTSVIYLGIHNKGEWVFGDQMEAFGLKIAPAIFLDKETEEVSLKLILCSLDYNSVRNNLNYSELKGFYANSDFLPESIRVHNTDLDYLEPTRILPKIDNYLLTPRLVELNGNPYFEYVINIGLSLKSISTTYPTLYSEEEVDHPISIEKATEISTCGNSITTNGNNTANNRNSWKELHPIWILQFLMCFFLYLLGKLRSLFKSN